MIVPLSVGESKEGEEDADGTTDEAILEKLDDGPLQRRAADGSMVTLETAEDYGEPILFSHLSYILVDVITITGVV